MTTPRVSAPARRRQALPADGALLMAEPMAGGAGAEPIGDAYFGFYLLAMGSGRPRTPAELARLLARAGFPRAARSDAPADADRPACRPSLDSTSV